MADEVRMIDISLIDVPERGRKHSQESIDEMARDIEQNGLIEDGVVGSKADGRYTLAVGRRRLAALKKLGRTQFRCLVIENMTEEQRLSLMISENGERAAESPIDTGLSYIWLMETAKINHGELAKRINKTDSYVGQYVAAGRLSVPVQEISKRLEIGIGIINQIVRLEGDEAKIAMLERCEKEGLSVKQLEILVNRALKPQAGGPASSAGIGEGGVSSAAIHKAQPTGIRIVESAKGMTLPGILPKGSTKDDVHKAVDDAFQQRDDEQAMKAKAAAKPKPDPEALKTARAALKADKASMASLEKEIEGLETAAKGLEKIKRDSSGIRQDIAQKQAELKALKLKIKSAEKGLKTASAKHKKPAIQQAPSQSSQLKVSPQPQVPSQSNVSSRPRAASPQGEILPSANNATAGFDLIELKLSFDQAKPPAEKLTEISLMLNESKPIYATAQVMGHPVPLDKSNKEIKWHGEGVEVTPDWGPQVTVKLPAPLAQPGKLTVSCLMPNGQVIEASAVVVQAAS